MLSEQEICKKICVDINCCHRTNNNIDGCTLFMSGRNISQAQYDQDQKDFQAEREQIAKQTLNLGKRESASCLLSYKCSELSCPYYHSCGDLKEWSRILGGK